MKTKNTVYSGPDRKEKKVSVGSKARENLKKGTGKRNNEEVGGGEQDCHVLSCWLRSAELFPFPWKAPTLSTWLTP